ncbi:hypothetical protein KP509_22G005000 [Ceratopteris richardii]|uniref:Uncharacterized protein n=1 Tax=Ceratopteris richardii TaxID=49495 RepID=A0A8T2S4Y6_CERRI|nr:hypothetical protein KP509_22G005000 [Ceratopteris richardii]
MQRVYELLIEMHGYICFVDSLLLPFLDLPFCRVASELDMMEEKEDSTKVFPHMYMLLVELMSCLLMSTGCKTVWRGRFVTRLRESDWSHGLHLCFGLSDTCGSYVVIEFCCKMI